MSSTTLGRNSAWMLASRLARSAVAAVYFLMLARTLGVSGYGAFAGVCALIGIFAPFVGLGTANLLVQHVARDRSAFAQRWGICLATTAMTGAIATVVCTLVARFALPTSLRWTVALSIGLSDLIFARLLDAAAMAFQAIEQLSATAWLNLALTFSRMSAAIFVCRGRHGASPGEWAWFYLASTALAACAALCTVRFRIGRASFLGAKAPNGFLQGFYFSISLSAQTIYNDLDKCMLARMVSLAAAGVYGAAYRIVDAAFSPVNAVLAAAYARFFQHGAHGLTHSARFAARILTRALLYSSIAMAGIWIASPQIPRILGPSFAETAVAVRLLAPLLLLRSTHSLAADALTGAGFQGTRTALQIAVAILNVVLNLAVLPRYSWRGAAWTSLACDGALALSLWLAVWRFAARRDSSVSPTTTFTNAVAKV